MKTEQTFASEYLNSNVSTENRNKTNDIKNTDIHGEVKKGNENTKTEIGRRSFFPTNQSFDGNDQLGFTTIDESRVPITLRDFFFEDPFFKSTWEDFDVLR